MSTNFSDFWINVTDNALSFLISVLSDESSNTAPTIEEINLTIKHAGKEKSYIFNSENKYVTLGRLPGGDFESRHFHTGFFDCSVLA